MGNVMKYYNGTSWVPVASQYIDPDYAYLKAYDSPSNRNLIMNGAMQVAQRGTSTASITTAGYYTADRWYVNFGTLGTWTNSIENDAPTGSGFRKSFKVLVTTADNAPAAGDYAQLVQVLEGQDLQRIAKGTASAQQLTVSFWVKSNLTGTYVVEFFDTDNTRHVAASYTISASATWEKKTITFPADTTGAFDNDNAGSLSAVWWLGAGSTYTSGTLPTTWAASSSANRAVGQTNLAATINNYFMLTGVQLEVGPVATPFEFKSYGQELAECQRYYEKSYNIGVAPGTVTLIGAITTFPAANAVYFPIQFKVQKRVAPDIIAYNPRTGATGSYTYNNTNDVALTGIISVGEYGATAYTGANPGNVSAYLHYTASADL